MNVTFDFIKQDFPLRDICLQFGILHDQRIGSAALDGNCLTLHFPQYRIFREDFTDPTLFERFSRFQQCSVRLCLDGRSTSDDCIELRRTKRDKNGKGVQQFRRVSPAVFAEECRTFGAEFLYATVGNSVHLELFCTRGRFAECVADLLAETVTFVWT